MVRSDLFSLFPGSTTTVLITGGAGFIGSHLATALAARGCRVRVLDNLSSGKETNLAGLDVELVAGDIRDWPTVEAAVAGCDLIFHQAALVSVTRSIAEPQLNHEVNVTGAFHVFEAARQAGIKRVIYTSSAAVYGDNPSLPARESDRLEPISPYAAAKIMNEQLAAIYNRCYGMQMIGLRYFNVYGPRQDPTSPYSGVLSIFCQAAVKGEPVIIHGDGRQTRDFIYVSDVVAANLAAARLTWQPTMPTVFNIGTGRQTRLLEVVAILNESRPLPVSHGPVRAGDIRHSVADIALGLEWLGTSPAVSLSAGLQSTADWFADTAEA